MNNNNVKTANNKDSNFIKRLPRGWTSRVIRLVQEANNTLPYEEQIAADRGSVYSVAKRQSITHPLWPFIQKVVLEKRISLKEFHERKEKLDQLLNT